METILVSNCLLGKKCRYDGRDNLVEEIEKLKESYNIIGVCPEELGGLSTPRDPSEIINGRVVTNNGVDVTEKFRKGALDTLEIAMKNNIRLAILKEKSPSCGFGKIYDGNFSGVKIDGNGITSDLLDRNYINILGETQINKIKRD